MSCCGNKRAELSVRRAVRTPDSAPQTEPERRSASPRWFEYIGSGVVIVRGVATGSTYRFAQGGGPVEVAYEDAFAMMAEPGLRSVSNNRR